MPRVASLKALDPDLKPGKYAVQFVFDGRNFLRPKEMINRWTPLSTEQLQRWRIEAQPDVFRSNVVRIEVVAD